MDAMEWLDETTAFPTLGADELASLEALGERRKTQVGEFLYRAGDEAYEFYVLLSGLVDIVLDRDGEEQLIAQHGAGRFLGELNLLSGQRVYVSARVNEPGEVIALPAEVLRRLLATNARLGDTILRAFMARRENLLAGASASLRLLGSRYRTETHAVREFLTRNRIPHEWLDPEQDPSVQLLERRLDIACSDLPVLIAAGRVLKNVTPGTVSEYLGLTVDRLPERCFDLVVVGSGPGGLAAGVYGASEGLRTLVVEKVVPGGQAGTSSRIENYLGFPLGISGGDLTQRALVQAEKFGAHLTSPCAAVSLREKAGHLVIGLEDGTEIAGRAVIVATGAKYRRLPVDRLSALEGNGVYYAATESEARACGSEPVIVVGGGNSAGQAAMFLADNGNDVTIVIRKPDLSSSMSRYLIDRIDVHPRITVRAHSQIVGLEGDRSLSGVRLNDSAGDATVPCGALFSFIGAEPTTGWLDGCAALDKHGFVLTDRALEPEHLDERWQLLDRQPLPYETSYPGLFAVGDVRSGSPKRVAAAVGEGSSAVRAVHDFLAFAH